LLSVRGEEALVRRTFQLDDAARPIGGRFDEGDAVAGDIHRVQQAAVRREAETVYVDLAVVQRPE
jgi:hypothetical protein